MIPIAQLASVLGVFGLSGFIAFVTASIVLAFGPARSRDTVGPIGQYAPATLAFLLVWASASGAASGSPLAPDARRRANDRRPDPGERRPGREVGCGACRRDLRRLPAPDPRSDWPRARSVVVWPESSTPFFFEEDRPRAEQVRAIARESQVSILLGSDQIERGPPVRYFNAAFLVGPDGETGGGVSQDAPGAVRRVRAAQVAAVLRRAPRRSGVGLLGRRGCVCCCRSARIR